MTGTSKLSKPIDMSALKGSAPPPASAPGTAIGQAMSAAGVPGARGAAPAPKAKTPESTKAAPAPKAKTPKSAPKITAPPGTQGNDQIKRNSDKAADKATDKNKNPNARKVNKDDNSHVTLEELTEAANNAGDALGGVMGADDKIEKTKEKQDSLRRVAAEQVFPIMERLGIDASWSGKEFAKNAKELNEYNTLRNLTCRRISAKVRDKVAEKTDKGGSDTPVFSGRVKKQWSRLTTSYREGGEGGSTNADNKGREDAKERNKVMRLKADNMDALIQAHTDGDNDQVEAIIKQSAARWPSPSS